MEIDKREKLEALIGVLFTESEKTMVAASAAEHGVSVSHFIRQIVLQALKK